MRPEFYAVCRPLAKMGRATAQGGPSTRSLKGSGCGSSGLALLIQDCQSFGVTAIVGLFA